MSEQLTPEEQAEQDELKQYCEKITDALNKLFKEDEQIENPQIFTLAMAKVLASLLSSHSDPVASLHIIGRLSIDVSKIEQKQISGFKDTLENWANAIALANAEVKGHG